MAKVGYPSNGSKSPEDRARREAHWRALVNEWRKSGLTQGKFSQAKSISDSSLGWWVRELNRRDRSRGLHVARKKSARADGPAFIPVKLVPPTWVPAAPAFEVVVCGHTIRVPAGFDPESLRRLVGVLEARA